MAESSHFPPIISPQTRDSAGPAEGAADRLAARRPTPAGCNATGLLKLIALVFMIIDHIGAVIFPEIPALRMLGRIAFPIYCWCLVVGFHYTRSVPKYLLRILLVGLISQPLYITAMNHAWTKPNIFLTLLLGLLGLWGLREKWYGSQIWAPVAVIVLATVLEVDYGWKGVLFILLLYACRGSRPAIAAVMIAYFLFWGTFFSNAFLLPLPVSLAQWPNYLRLPLNSFLRLETYGLLSLFFILPRFSQKVRLPVWAGYALYPAHLLLIMLLKALIL